MDAVQKLFVELRYGLRLAIRTRGPHIPPELTRKIKTLCDVFASAGSEERSVMISLVQPSFSFVFLWFAKEMAIQAVLENSQQAIVDGLTALFIENCKFDSRDSNGSTRPSLPQCGEGGIEHKSALHKCSANDK